MPKRRTNLQKASRYLDLVIKNIRGAKATEFGKRVSRNETSAHSRLEALAKKSRLIPRLLSKKERWALDMHNALVGSRVSQALGNNQVRIHQLENVLAELSRNGSNNSTVSKVVQDNFGMPKSQNSVQSSQASLANSKSAVFNTGSETVAHSQDNTSVGTNVPVSNSVTSSESVASSQVVSSNSTSFSSRNNADVNQSRPNPIDMSMRQGNSSPSSDNGQVNPESVSGVQYNQDINPSNGQPQSNQNQTPQSNVNPGPNLQNYNN